MQKKHLLVLLTSLACSGSLLGADMVDGTWRFGQPRLRDGGVTIFIPLILEAPSGIAIEHVTEVSPTGIEFTKSSGLVVFGETDYQNKLVPLFSFNIANTNELKKLMESHLEWKKLIPAGKTENDLLGSFSVEAQRLGSYRTQYSDESGTCAVKFHGSKKAYALPKGEGRTRYAFRFTYGMELVRRGSRAIYELPALFHVFVSLDQVQQIFEDELARQEGREIAIDEARKKKIAGELAAAIALANKKLSDAQRGTEARLDEEQKERQLALIKKENDEAIVKAGEEGAAKRRAKIATFLTSKKGDELKTKIEQAAKSISDRANREGAYLVKMEQSLEKVMFDNVQGKVTGKQLQQAINEYAIASSSHKESSTLQQERANLKTLLDEFKAQLGISYDDAMSEMSRLRKPANSK